MLFSPPAETAKFMIEVTVTRLWSECCLGPTKAMVFPDGLQS